MNTQGTHMHVLRKGLALTGLLAGMLLGAGSVLAHAEDMPPPKPTPEMRKQFEERCKADPQKCEAMKKRMEERRAACQADPEACKKEREAHRAKMKAQCEKDPEACKQKREEMRKQFEERCKSDPQKCEEWKKHHPHPGHHDGKPIAPPPPPQAAN